MAQLAAVALFLGAACGSEQPDSGGSTAPITRAALDGLDLLLDTSEGFEPVDGTAVRLRFHDGELSATAGCNHLGGAFQVRDTKLIMREIGGTEIGCEAALHAQDQWLAEFLTSSPIIARDGDRLTLTGADASLTFLDREVADPDQPLAGPVWTIDTFIRGGGASNLALAMDPTITFHADGTLEVQSTCNTSRGNYAVSDDELTLSNIAFTERACTGNELSPEQHVQEVIANGTVTFEIDARRLTLKSGDVGLSATRAAGAD